MAHAMRAENLPGFARRRPCASEMPLVFPLISRASSQGRMLLRPHEGILLKGKERLMDRVERLILLAAEPEKLF